MMERINRILSHPSYREYYGKLERLEKDRKFCRHQMGHLLDVARIACIRNLEEGLGLDKEIIYETAVRERQSVQTVFCLSGRAGL